LSSLKLNPSRVRAHPEIAPINYAVIIRAAHITLIKKFYLPSFIRTATVTAGLKCPPEIPPKMNIKQNNVTHTASAA
jgi:hypothetical protein